MLKISNEPIKIYDSYFIRANGTELILGSDIDCILELENLIYGYLEGYLKNAINKHNTEENGNNN